MNLDIPTIIAFAWLLIGFFVAIVTLFYIRHLEDRGIEHEGSTEGAIHSNSWSGLVLLSHIPVVAMMIFAWPAIIVGLRRLYSKHSVKIRRV